jgi:NAD(P)-dependent dehydrogenase (short-subunit alcohol dehydrogenase family)
MAQAFIQEGANVVVASRSQESVESAVTALKAFGRAAGRVCNVSDREQVQDLANLATLEFGGFEIWVNNAGIAAPYGPTIQVEPEAFVEVIQTNILGTYYGSVVAMRHFLSKPVDGNRGKLINILGRGDRQQVPNQNAYAASKAWVRSFTLALAKEYKDSGIGIFAFNPGMMETALLEDVEVVAGYEDRLKIMPTIIRMWASPPEVPAERAVWLASEATDGKTGLEVHQSNPLQFLVGVLREAWLRITGQGEPTRPVQVRPVPPAFETNAGKKLEPSYQTE